ncbi:hypothetical protein [Nitrosopumilus oxyclinae]|nr:hypothetical protein [Nitrosopumilus oxyclinae]
MEHKLIFASIPLFVLITVFSLTIQDSFGETRIECRGLMISDASLTPVERVYALKTCDQSENKISQFQKYYSEELHNECPRILKEKTNLNHVSRLNDLKECNKLQLPESLSKSQKLTKFTKRTIDICDEKYGVYLFVGAKNMRNQAGGLAEQCVELYLAPMWNSTASDRKTQLHNFISEKIKQSVQEDEDLRQKGIEEAQLNDPVFLHLKYLFVEQKEKIEYMENQLRQKSIIPNYSNQNFFNEKYEDCIDLIYDKTISGREKINALDECPTETTISFDDKEILRHSKHLAQLCEKAHNSFLNLSLEDYYASMRNQPASECVLLYKDPIWKYNQDDRMQVIEKFVYDKTLSDNQKYIERKNFVTEAHLNAGMVPILSDLYQYQKQKIELLENFLKTEKN